MTSTPLCIAYYQGAYGPTIRIDAQEKDHLLLLRGLLFRLVHKQEVEITVDESHFSNVQLVGLDRLILKLRPDSQTSSSYVAESHQPTALIKKVFSIKPRNEKAITLVPKNEKGLGYIWEQISEEWGDSMEKVDKLFEQIVPCHYYLSQEGIDDALLELAYLEPRIGELDAVSS